MGDEIFRYLAIFLEMVPPSLLKIWPKKLYPIGDGNPEKAE
jgi:hypothetical protein